jgi:hypothetical protein
MELTQDKVKKGNMKNSKNTMTPDMEKELRKQGINPDFIDNYGDVDFADFDDEYYNYSRVKDNYSEYGDDDY